MNLLTRMLSQIRSRKGRRNLFYTALALLLLGTFGLIYLDTTINSAFITDGNFDALSSFMGSSWSLSDSSKDPKPYDPRIHVVDEVNDPKEKAHISKDKPNLQKEQGNLPKEQVKTSKEEGKAPKEQLKDPKEQLKVPKEQSKAPKEQSKVEEDITLSEGPAKEKLKSIRKLAKSEDADRLAMGHSFYKKVIEDFIKAKPKLEKKLERYLGEKIHAEGYEADKKEPLFSEEYLSKYLQVNANELEALSDSHKYIKQHLPEIAPSGLYSGDGIVYVGGGKFNWLTLISIKSLRGYGCDLPVEILIPNLDEFDIDLCTEVFPSLNAKCIYLPTILYGDDVDFAKRVDFKGYQYKSLAILVSSFENVLLMDGDNMPVMSPSHLFKNEPYLSSGLVVWPDFWRRSTSPSFYHISDQEISKTELLPKYQNNKGFYQPQTPSGPFDWFSGVPYHERLGAIPEPSTESGQLMISKKTHFKPLLLANYYNFYGPEYYYPVFSQGAPGEGDKETFIAATVVLKKKFYQVGRKVNALGNFKNGQFFGHGMAQFDPVEDYKLSLQKKDVSKKLEGKELEEAFSKFDEANVLFLHANFPKLDPWALRETGQTFDKDGRHRLYSADSIKLLGKDLEMDIWKHMNEILCEKKLNIDHFKSISRGSLCDDIYEQLKHLENTSEKSI